MPTLPPLDTYAATAHQHGGVDFRPTEPNAHGLAKMTGNVELRTRLKVKRERGGKSRATIFADPGPEGGARYKYDSVLGAVPCD